MRQTMLERKTNETAIEIELNIDGSGKYEISTGLSFLDHMLEQLAKHSGFDIRLNAVGDTNIDCHHTMEDVGIALGKALRMCIGDGTGISRYGSTCIPMDECLTITAADLCGRANLVFNCSFKKPSIGDIDTEAVEEFFKAFCQNAAITLHINLMYGANTHHMVECIFKSTARALKQGVSLNSDGALMSTKGCLT